MNDHFVESRITDVIANWNSPRNDLIERIHLYGELFRIERSAVADAGIDLDEVWRRLKGEFRASSTTAITDFVERGRDEFTSSDPVGVVVNTGDEGTRELFVRLDQLELVAGFHQQSTQTDEIFKLIEPLRDVIRRSPWVFVQLGEFVQAWEKTFDDDDLSQPLTIQLSRCKFEAVVREYEEAIAGLEDQPTRSATVRLATRINSLAASEPELAVAMAAATDAMVIATTSYKFRSPGGEFVAEMTVTVTRGDARHEADITIVSTSLVAKASVALLADKPITFGGASSRLTVREDIAEATLQVREIGRVPLGGFPLKIEGIDWGLIPS